MARGGTARWAHAAVVHPAHRGGARPRRVGCHRAAFRPDRGLGHRHPRTGRLPTPTASTAAAATGLPVAATVAGAPVAGRARPTRAGLVPEPTETLVDAHVAHCTPAY